MIRIKELRFPKREEIEEINKKVMPNPEEKKYWSDLVKRRNSQFDFEDISKDYNAMRNLIAFYIRELRAAEGKFGDRIALERKLKYEIGQAYERLGTHLMEDHDSIGRSKALQKAMMWYKKADEAIGFLSDYALRQAEASAGAGYFRREAGLDDEIADWFFDRRDQILRQFTSSIAPNAEMVIIGRGMPKKVREKLNKIADHTIDSVVKGYILKAKDPRRN